MHRGPTTRPRGPLGPVELAEAVVLGDVSLALIVVGQVVPFGGALLAAAVVPLAVVAARHRLRAVLVGAIAASTVGFLVIGSAAPQAMAACGALGALVGAADRRGWSRRRTMSVGLAVLWPPIAAMIDLGLLLFVDARKLALDNIRNGWRGLFHLLHNLDGAVEWFGQHPEIAIAVGVLVVVRLAVAVRASAAHDRRFTPLHALSALVALALVTFMIVALGASERRADRAIATIVRDWWASIPIALFGLLWFGIWLAHGLATPALRRVRVAFGAAFVDDEIVDSDITNNGASGAPDPLPTRLTSVYYRYPNAPSDALADVSLDVHPRELLAIVGANGSGKSTLARVIAGRRAPTTGRVERPGAVGLGRFGGTSIVFQRPEAQVLGVRVRDDVVWGLRDRARRDVDVDALLDRVGLRELAARETSTLSGGELQRLAVAAALAREPRLFVSDEATAMVDRDGRDQLIALFRALATDDGVGVVHVTHHPAEAAVADSMITLDAGRIVDSPRGSPTARANPSEAPRPPDFGAPIVELRDVGHVYSRRTPWANRALANVDLTMHGGETLLVVGHNGSGKSTLAWILAGLLAPSEGIARLDGTPINDQVGRVGLAFQHARLQLLRPTVLAEVRAVASVDEAAALDALRAVGLDADAIAPRRVDELSGGQARRVVLAGVLATQPRAIVLDEPFAGLDASGRDELESMLVGLRHAREVAIVVISHDSDAPDHLVDRVVELDRGRIVRDEPAGDVVPGATA